MSKITRITAASALVAGVAALSPLSAQAKAADPYTGGALTSCFGAPGTASSTVTPGTNTASYSITVNGDVRDFEYRARYAYRDAAGRLVFSKSKNVNPAGSPTTYSGSVSGNRVFIWRIDVVVPANETAGIPALAYTSDPLGCD